MTLAAGTKLAHYTIVSKVGAGGMGEVYLAQDTNSIAKLRSRFFPLIWNPAVGRTLSSGTFENEI
jgi:serine/threonine protein kinase